MRGGARAHAGRAGRKPSSAPAEGHFDGAQASPLQWKVVCLAPTDLRCGGKASADTRAGGVGSGGFRLPKADSKSALRLPKEGQTLAAGWGAVLPPESGPGSETALESSWKTSVATVFKCKRTKRWLVGGVSHARGRERANSWLRLKLVTPSARRWANIRLKISPHFSVEILVPEF